MATRRDDEQPAATGTWGWRFHHVGVPTDQPRPGEQYLDAFKIHVSGFETSAYGVQWMRYEPDSPVHELIKSIPHVAFEVDDLDAALQGKDILTPPNSPSAGVRVAMIVENGCPIELMQFDRKRKEPASKGV
ncbi:MAG: hypothetical protein ACM3NQ_06115 [Bacteroidales bacterium]